MRSYHITVQRGYHGSLNRCGGVPTHLPEVWPQIDGTDLTFLFQIYCDGKMLDIPNTLCIQGYQWIEHGNYIGEPEVLQISLGAKENTARIGRSFPVELGLPSGDFVFEEVEEKEAYDVLQEFDQWYKSGVPFSKLGGWCEAEIIPPGCRFLGWLADEDPFVMGAGYNLCLFLSPEGKVLTRFHRP